jgi:DNA-binding SARP family transcriptional activator
VEERARHTLNTTLWRINRVLEPSDTPAGGRGHLRVSPQHIGFNATGVWLDVAEFESRCLLAEQTDALEQRFALYSQAIQLYRGDLLSECYEDWCIVERERLQGLYVRALAYIMAYNSQKSDYDRAIDCARRILSCDPLREEVHRDLMRLHLDAGQPAAALRQYRQCEDLLRHELGVQPAPETRALLTPILDATTHPDPSPRSAPPRDLTVLSARIADLSAACEAASAQLAEAMTLLRELTSTLEPEAREPVPFKRVVGGKA